MSRLHEWLPAMYVIRIMHFLQPVVLTQFLESKINRKVKAIDSSEMLTKLYQTTLRHSLHCHLCATLRPFKILDISTLAGFSLALKGGLINSTETSAAVQPAPTCYWNHRSHVHKSLTV
jgi:hypothetical protein